MRRYRGLAFTIDEWAFSGAKFAGAKRAWWLETGSSARGARVFALIESIKENSPPVVWTRVDQDVLLSSRPCYFICIPFGPFFHLVKIVKHCWPMPPLFSQPIRSKKMSSENKNCFPGNSRYWLLQSCTVSSRFLAEPLPPGAQSCIFLWQNWLIIVFL